ncbi:HAD-IA family hydrolase [Echinimonas agarilytica]|uniref:HAD-IA family hydrolase n=1 Tax=Echinimonas agarilytica TaxID=1215918 RepID=A0AA41W3Y6_9GAMM|nr:HAD-IA family hydrolase [Echinimonas agarilytica]MCM2678260.1 HAD-IA family hydrolase [Echinimonas agarilytica]
MKFYRDWVRPTAISFDLDDTLYDNVPIMIAAETALIDWLALKCEAFQGMTMHQWMKQRQGYAALHPEVAHDVTALRLSSLQHAFEQQGYSAQDAASLAVQGLNVFLQTRNDFQVPPDNVALLQRLAQHYPIIAITNGNARPDNIGLAGIFDHVLSPKAGEFRMKPYCDLFRHAEQQTGHYGSAWLHVGDHIVSDVVGAINAGWQAAWFNESQLNIPFNKYSEHSVRLPHLEYTHFSDLVDSLT